MAKKEKNVEPERAEAMAPEGEKMAEETTGVEIAPVEPPAAPTLVRMVTTDSLKFTWSEGEQCFTVAPLDAGGKALLSGMKVRRGEPVGAHTTQAIATLADNWQRKANTLAAIFSQD